MRSLKIITISVYFLCNVFLMMAFCDVEYTDGVYEGEYSFVKVQITVEKGKIEDISILNHGGGGKKYEKMIEPLLDEMLKNQSTDIDAVTGATVSSKNLVGAVNNALLKAAK